jgi:hypothetical protein
MLLYCGVSVSGTGYFALIPIQDPAKHLEHFLALEKVFRNLVLSSIINVRMSTGFADIVTTVSLISITTAKTFTATYAAPRPARINYRPTGDNDTANVESCLNHYQKNITGDYGTWFEIGCSLANAFGESGRQ